MENLLFGLIIVYVTCDNTQFDLLALEVESDFLYFPFSIFFSFIFLFCFVDQILESTFSCSTGSSCWIWAL